MRRKRPLPTCDFMKIECRYGGTRPFNYGFMRGTEDFCRHPRVNRALHRFDGSPGCQCPLLNKRVPVVIWELFWENGCLELPGCADLDLYAQVLALVPAFFGEYMFARKRMPLPLDFNIFK